MDRRKVPQIVDWILGSERIPFGHELPLFIAGPMDTNAEVALMVPAADVQEMVTSADAGVAVAVTARGVVDRTDSPLSKSRQQCVLELLDCIEPDIEIDYEENCTGKNY
jgi:hypothetical protein